MGSEVRGSAPPLTAEAASLIEKKTPALRSQIRGSNPPSLVFRRTGHSAAFRSVVLAGRSEPVNAYKSFRAILGWVEGPKPDNRYFSGSKYNLKTCMSRQEYAQYIVCVEVKMY